MVNNILENNINNFDEKQKMTSLMQKLYFFDAFKEFILLFAEMNIGTRVEINIRAISEYLSSSRFSVDISIERMSKEDIFILLEKDLLNGMPIWQFLILTDWQRKFLLSEYEEIVKENEKKLKKKYICFRNCKYYREYTSEFGTWAECLYKEAGRSRFSSSRSSREVPKISCKFYLKNKEMEK